MKAVEFACDLVSSPAVKPHLESLAGFDIGTFRHSARIFWTSVLAGGEMDLTLRQWTELACGALFHDLGKTGIPRGIIVNNGSLDPKQTEQVRLHPEYGFGMLANFPFNGARGPVIAHHRYKENPYPEEGRSHMSELAAVVAALDQFDALAYSRPYRDGLSMSKVEEILRAQFIGDPNVIDLAMRIGKQNLPAELARRLRI
ncbi:HD domain-containing protein [Candidatus Daviesbacteria bacterium]|nr:HD domain-containing protein [Candidatus Daviesbacteria bacterium]